MWKLSDIPNELTRRLFEIAKSIGGLSESLREDEICRLLERLGDQLEHTALSCGVSFLFSPSERVRASARLAVRRLLSRVSPDELRSLYSNLWVLDYDLPQSWKRLQPDQLISLVGDEAGPDYSSVLGLASMHRDGYVRHAAVRLLAQITDGSEFPFLLLRINDWVDPISVDALMAIAWRIDRSLTPDLYRCVKTLMHLDRFSRQQLGDIPQRLLTCLFNQLDDNQLRSLIGSPDRELRNWFVKTAVQRPEHLSRVTAIGIESPHPTVRLACYRALRTGKGPPGRDDIVAKGLHDEFMPVRREMYRMMAEHEPDQSMEIWQRALLDSSSAIRELAIYSLRKLGVEKIAAIYRMALVADPTLRSAVEGLSEAGDASDRSFFEGLLSHPSVSYRIASVKFLGRVCGKSATDELINALRDPHARVTRAARKSFSDVLNDVQPAQILAVAVEGQDARIRNNAVEILAELGKWRSLQWLLRAAIARGSEDETSQKAVQLIEHLLQFGRNYPAQTVTERDAILMVLGQATGKVSPKIVAQITKEVNRWPAH